MAKEKKPPPEEGDQFSDILLLIDNKNEKKIVAVSDIDKNGNIKSVDATKEHQNEFLRLDKHSSILDNFLTNFWRQARDPTQFTFLRVAQEKFKNFKNVIDDIRKGKQTPETEEFIKNHKIEQNQNNKEMAKESKTETQATNAQIPETQPATSYRFNESMIDWEQLKNFGISKEYLQEKNMLDGMLKGYKSNMTVPISMNFGAAVLRTDARLSLQTSISGQVVLAIHGIRKEPDLDRPFFGHIFSDEDKKNLKESGNMGRVVELKSKSGEYTPSFVSIDKLTNEIVALKVDSVFIPNEIKEVKLTEQEKNDLKEGKSVFLEGMIANSGNEFNANVQINADKRGIEFIFPENKLFNGNKIGGVELTEKQSQDLQAGKAIFLEDMKRKDGDTFSAFVKLDEGSGRPAYTRYNPDTPEGSREIYVPKEMHNTMLTPEDRQQLREGKPVFIENMINSKGEEFSSFVKLDLETGRPSYSKTPDGFSERKEFKIPAEVWGVTLTATQRAGLQDGKAVLVDGMKGFDGKEFSSYLKVNENQGKLNYFTENPDRKREASQRNVVKPTEEVKQAVDKKKSGKKIG